MHSHAATIDQLLSLRDGEPVSAGVALHVSECAICARELARLRERQAALRQLPSIAAPPYDAAALYRRRHGRPQWQSAGLGVLAAGVCAVAIMVGFNVRRESVAPSMQVDTAPVVAQLVSQSQDLESRLASLPSRPQVERASTSITIDTLQGRIQWVDYQLTLADQAGISDHDAVRLWRDRVQLMNSLVTVRYAEAQRAAFLVSNGSSL